MSLKALPLKSMLSAARRTADKETEKMTRRLSARVRCAVCATPKNPRALPAQELADAFCRDGLRVYVEDDAARALAKARSLAGPEGIVLAAGSLYMIGELRTLLRQEKEFSNVV